MCGIAGFIDYRKRFAGEEMRDLAREMACAVEHRGPDDSGEWVDADAGIAFGHRRLSIIDLSPLGAQPMISHSGRFVIVYNGEVYNFPALRHELEAEGLHFKGNSDTEVILAAIERWGIDGAVTRFNGMFAFALWDRRERELQLVRDRLGIKPLYFGRSDGSILFASELKAMRRHPAFKPEIDRDVLALFFRFNYIPEPWSIYKGISKLPPGTMMKFGADGAEEGPRPYWSAVEAVERGLAEPFNGSEDEAIGELEALLRDSVGMRMISDVPLGALLSGGIDSSLVSSLMQVEASGRIKTFTIGFEAADYNEADDARAVAAHLGTEHTELYVNSGDALAVIPEMPRIYDEPFSDSSQIPTYLVSRLVREHVTVCLSGDGGDELFGGYNRHVWLERIRKGVGRLPRVLRAALAMGIKALPARSWDAIYRAAGRILPGDHHQRTPGEKLHKLADFLPLRDADAMYYAALSHWREPTKLVIGASEPPVFVTREKLHPAMMEYPHKMMFLDLMSYLPGDILTKVDRASMAVSLESRVPYLDHRVVELAWRLPLEFKIRDGVGKLPLRRLLYQHVPQELVDRPKAGFGAPIVDWLRGPLREWAEELLREDRMRREGFIEPEPVREKWRQHLSGRRNWQYHLWDVLMFQAWNEVQR